MWRPPGIFNIGNDRTAPPEVRRLRAASRIINTLFVLALLGTVAYASAVATDFLEIRDNLQHHMATVVRKGDVLGRLRAAVGYGGFIHDFKNYVLRQEGFRPRQLALDLAEYRALVGEYRTLGVSPAERKALDDIEHTFDAYAAMIPKAEKAAADGLTPTETDRIVKVDDTAALAAFETLHKLWREGRERYSRGLEASVEDGFKDLYAAACALPVFILVGAGLIWFQRRLVREIRSYAEVSERLAATDALNRAVLDGVAHAIIGADAEGNITVFNRAASEMLGYTPDEMIGRHASVFHDETEVARRAAALSAETGQGIKPGPDLFGRLIGGGEPYTAEWTYIRKDGGRVPVMASLAVLGDPEDPRHGIVGIAYDIADRKKLEHMQHEFVSTVSHELRTPLTSIVGSLSLVQGGAAGDIPEKAQTLVDMARRNSERLIQLVNDILDVERLMTERMTFEFAVEPVQEMIDDAVATNGDYARMRGVELVAAERIDARVRADRKRIAQVLANLLSNAAKFSPDGAQVEVAAEVDGDYVRIRVVDHGTGIPPKYRERAFDRFWQVDSSDTRAKEGTGLGLSIAKAIVERHKGTIEIEDTPGGGATLAFTLLLAGGAAD